MTELLNNIPVETNIDIDGEMNVGQEATVLELGVSVEITTSGVYSFLNRDGKVKVTKNNEDIFIGEECVLEVSEGETYIVSGVESSLNDLIKVDGIRGSYKNIYIKDNACFDNVVGICFDDSEDVLTPNISYNSNLEVEYKQSNGLNPGIVNISDYIKQDLSKVRPINWAKKCSVYNSRVWADGILFPKREDEVIHNYNTYNFTMTDSDGDIESFIEDEIPFRSGIEMKTNSCGTGFSSSKTTFISTTLIFGDSYPSSNTKLIQMHNGDKSYYLDIGVTPSGFMTSKIVSDNNVNTDWTGANTRYKFELNTIYNIEFGYINGAYLLRLNGSDNAKFSRQLSADGPVYFTVGSTSCNDGDIRYTFSSSSVSENGAITWQPEIIDTKKHNYIINGNPILDDDIMSGFTTDSYITTDINAMDFSVLPWVLETKITTSGDINTQQIIFEGVNGYNDALRIQIYQGHLRPAYNVAGIWVFNEPTSQTISANTTYWVKVIVNENTCKTLISIDGLVYTEIGSKEISTYPSPKKYVIGVGETCPFLGSIDLGQTSITQNGKLLWSPFTESHAEIVETYKAYTVEEKFALTTMSTINGSLNINPNGVVSGFSSSSYITLPSNLFTMPMEMYVKFTTGDNISTMQNLFHKNDFMEVFVTGNTLKMWSSQTGEVVITSVSPNTTYWLKVIIDQPAQIYYVSTEGFYNYNIEKTVNHTNIAIGTTAMKFGGHNSGSNQWRGTIDFSQTKLVANGETIWRPYTSIETSHDVYGLCVKDFTFNGGDTVLNAYEFVYTDGTKEILLGTTFPEMEEGISSISCIREGILVGQNDVYTWTYDREQERFILNNTYIVKFNVKPSGATISIESSIESVVETNDGYLVPKGAEITYTVSKDYYETKTYSTTVNENMTIDVELNINEGYLDADDYNITISDDKLILERYTGNDTDVIIPNI